MAYPLPSIGEEFPEIFEETLRLNQLDNEVYRKVQQCIIDALDKARAVRVTGRGNNRTDITVQLWKLINPETETIFENCTADVNIPAGEVFTSPVLAGTDGTLHVTSVFLGSTEYKNLEIAFKDGKTTTYSCENYSSKEENEKFIKENLLKNHDWLPLGEFAIGTNTIAYTMGKKFGITEVLPILIAEKTGRILLSEIPATLTAKTIKYTIRTERKLWQGQTDGRNFAIRNRKKHTSTATRTLRFRMKSWEKSQLFVKTAPGLRLLRTVGLCSRERSC